MIKEAIESILTLAPSAKEGRLPDLDAGHLRRYRDANGNISEFHVQPPRAHVAHTIRDFVQAVVTFRGDQWLPDVFIGEKAVVCNIDTHNRLDRITLPLVFSEAMATLDMLREEDNHDQSQTDFVRLLDTVLSGVFDEKIYTICKSVTVETNGAVRSQIAQGKRSMGQDIDREVGKAIDIPTSILARLPVYRNLDLRSYQRSPECRLIVTPEIQFTLFITDDERQRIIDETLEFLYGALAGAGISKDRLFIGTP